ncbi:hypothetical protein BC941DRAFT_452964 [Chlamydoabsidia padenii]|nr:hypothetical protein BC941DRAFT_452964 [Chlamydoabsidia padenii]
MALEDEDTSKSDTLSQQTTTKRNLDSYSTDSSLKKQCSDFSRLDNDTNNGGSNPVTPKDIAPLPPHDNATSTSNISQPSNTNGAQQQETLSIFGESDSEQDNDIDVEILTASGGSSDLATTTDTMEFTIKESVTTTDNTESKKQIQTTGSVNSATPPTTSTSETGIETQSVISSPITSGLTTPQPFNVNESHTSTAPAQSASSSELGKEMPTSLPETKDNTRFTIIDRSSDVRLPFSDKFFFTEEAYEAYSCDSFAATVERMVKKNKPGLALSSDPSKPTTITDTSSQQSSTNATTSQYRSHSPTTHDDNNSNGDSTDHGDNNTKNNNTSPAVGDNMLDSLLDSISKNDRPVKQPPPLPPPPPPPSRPLSDIEIAMQAADLPKP